MCTHREDYTYVDETKNGVFISETSYQEFPPRTLKSGAVLGGDSLISDETVKNALGKVPTLKE